MDLAKVKTHQKKVQVILILGASQVASPSGPPLSDLIYGQPLRLDPYNRLRRETIKGPGNKLLCLGS